MGTAKRLGSSRRRVCDGRRPVAVDLFAGAGGLSLGLEQAGFDVLASVEYDPVHAATHAYNFPATQVVCDDLATVSVDDIAAAAAAGWTAHGRSGRWSGEIDLVAGGPPCQGFSWIGKRQVDDVRNDLIFHFYRVVRALKPTYFVMENVPGMASGRHRVLLEDLIARFRRSGYSVAAPRILNAADYGVPQDRRRLILIGNRRDAVPAAYPAPTVVPARRVRSAARAEHGARSDVLLPGGPTVWDAIGDLPNLDDFPCLLETDAVKLTAAQRKRMDLAAASYAQQLRCGGDCDDRGHPRQWDRGWLTSSTRTVHTELSIERFAATDPGTVEPVSRFLRLDPDGLCNTLRAGTGGERGAYTSPRPVHPVHPRVISVREAARLHSFPDWFRLHSTKWHGFRQIGNAVPPRLGRAVGQAVVDALGARPGRPARAIELGDERLLKMTMKEAADAVGANHATIPKSRRDSRAAVAAEA